MGYAKAHDWDEPHSTASRLLSAILLSFAALLITGGMVLIAFFTIVDRMLAGIIAPIIAGIGEMCAWITWIWMALEAVFLLGTDWTELAWMLVLWLVSGFLS